MRFLRAAPLLLLLVACSRQTKPVIDFIGVSPGDLNTPIEQLKIGDRYPVSQRSYVGIVSFSEVQDGTTVEALWFSPDARSQPLGRTVLETESGATIARFSLTSQEDWNAAPFLFAVRAWKGEQVEANVSQAASRFYVGLSDQEIEEYLQSVSAPIPQE